MTEPKTLSPAEALRALADGKRLTFKGYYDSYVWLDRDYIIWSDGTIFKSDFNNAIEYTEPKPKVVWVEYLCTSEEPTLRPIGHISWFQKDNPHGIGPTPGWTYTPTGRKIEV